MAVRIFRRAEAFACCGLTEAFACFALTRRVERHVGDVTPMRLRTHALQLMRCTYIKNSLNFRSDYSRV